MKSHLLTPAIILGVIADLKPAIQNLLVRHKREHLYLVVMAEGSRPDGFEYVFSDSLAGLPESYPKPYGEIAVAKAEICVRTHMNGSDVVNNFPHLLRTGDVIYGGGIYHPGLVVAVSGAPLALDELISNMIASAILTEVKLRYPALRAAVEEGSQWKVPGKMGV